MHGPLLVLIFNRPALTARIFATIRNARPPRLYVAADGPRPGHPTDAAQTQAARAVATAIDWPCQLHTRFLPTNLGCRRAVETALDWFFAAEPQGIVLEDDMLPHPSFFPFVEELLDRYAHDTRIGIVSGLNLLPPDPDPPASYAFSNYFHMWGWGTWARVWADHRVAMPDWPRARADRLLARTFHGRRTAIRHWTRTMDATYARRADAWDNALAFSQWRAGRINVIPSINMVTNIGFGADATDTTGPMPAFMRRAVPRAMPMPLVHPREIAADPMLDARIERESLRIGWWSELKAIARALLGRLR